MSGLYGAKSRLDQRHVDASIAPYSFPCEQSLAMQAQSHEAQAHCTLSLPFNAAWPLYAYTITVSPPVYPALERSPSSRAVRKRRYTVTFPRSTYSRNSVSWLAYYRQRKGRQSQTSAADYVE